MSTCSGRTGAGEITVAACMPRRPADIFVDGDVHAGDLAILLGVWGPCPQSTFDANVQTAPFARYTEIMLRPHRNWIVLILLSGCLGLPLVSPADPPDGYCDPEDSSDPMAFRHTRQVVLKPRGNRLIRQDMHVRNIHRLDEFVGTSWIFGNQLYGDS